MYPLATARAAGAVMAANAGVPEDIATVWAGAESGVNNNPYGLTDGAGRLYAFSTLETGAAVAAAWLTNPASPYAAVRTAIAGGDAGAIVAAIEASPWGPAGYYAASWPKVAAAYGIALPAGGTPVTDPTPTPTTVPTVTITPLPAGQTGTVNAGARRFAATSPYPEISPETADSVQAFDAELAIADEYGTHGTYWRTISTPPVLFIKAAVGDTVPFAALMAQALAAPLVRTVAEQIIPAPAPITDTSGFFIAGVGGDTPTKTAEGGGIAYTIAQAVAWWQAALSSGLCLDDVLPSYQPGTHVLTARGYAAARELGRWTPIAPADYNPLGLPVVPGPLTNPAFLGWVQVGGAWYPPLSGEIALADAATTGLPNDQMDAAASAVLTALVTRRVEAGQP